MKRQDYAFMVIFFLIILTGDLTLIREPKTLSENENRSLQTFEHITLKTYLNGTYQKSLEDALSDQFIGGETIKLKLKDFLKFSDYNNIPKSVCRNKYVNLDGTYYNYNCDDALILKYEEMNPQIETNIRSRIDTYNNLNEYISTSYFFLSTSAIYNFEKNEYNIDMIKLLKDNLKNYYDFSTLEFKNYEEYSKYFYKTDHHWNHIGSYEGYKIIMSMLNPKDEILVPEEEVVFEDIIFYGSSARISQIFDFKENFKVYKFKYPSMKITNNTIYDNYGTEEEYFNGIFYKDKLAGHYGNFYGGDAGELIFDTGKKEKKNILILGSSFTNAINKLIASHYNKTYVIDLRHYEEIKDQTFDIKKYIKQNNIDKVLIIMDYGFLKDQSFDIDWSN